MVRSWSRTHSALLRHSDVSSPSFHMLCFFLPPSTKQQLSGLESVLYPYSTAHGHGSTYDLSGIMELRMSIRLSIPHRYPSSRLPSFHGVRWSSLWCGGRGTVFPKSIIQTRARPEVSWTKSRELPTTCGNKQTSLISRESQTFMVKVLFCSLLIS